MATLPYDRQPVFSVSLDGGKTNRIIDAETNNPAKTEHGDLYDNGGFAESWDSIILVSRINLSRGLHDVSVQRLADLGADYLRLVQRVRITASTNQADASVLKQNDYVASDDFSSVHWYGKTYYFTASQAAYMSVLLKLWEQGRLSATADVLAKRAGMQGSSIGDVFRESDAWGIMIVSPVRGSYCLAAPTETA